MYTDQCTLINIEPSHALPGPPRALPEPPTAGPELPRAIELSHDVFSTFVGQLHLKPLLLRAFLEGNPSEMLSKVGVIDGAVMKKSKKHCTGASPESPSIVKHNKFEPFGIHPRIQRIRRIRRIRCQELRLGPSLPRAPGVRMT